MKLYGSRSSLTPKPHKLVLSYASEDSIERGKGPGKSSLSLTGRCGEVTTDYR